MLLADLPDVEVHPAIEVPADIAVVHAEHAILTEADDFHLVFGHTAVQQFLFHGFGPLHPQLLVVAGRSLLVGIALDQYGIVLVLLEQVALGGELRLGFIRQALAARFEVDIAVNDVGDARDRGRYRGGGRDGGFGLGEPAGLLEDLRHLGRLDLVCWSSERLRIFRFGIDPGHGREACQEQDEAGEDDDVFGVFLRPHDGGGDVA